MKLNDFELRGAIMMTNYNKQPLNIEVSSLRESDSNKITTSDLESKTKDILDNKIHGICFSPYMDNDNPDLKIIVSDDQINSRLEIVESSTEWIRTFSCSHGNENIPRLSKQKGLKTLVGAWLSDDMESNEEEILNLIQVAKEGHADIVAVGNELLLREELHEDQLIEYINRVKKELPDIPVGYVDAYYIFRDYPTVADACDVILSNCYPFWECCSIEYSLDYMKHMYQIAKTVAKGKRVIITETGWPTIGEKYGGAQPSYENAMRYFIETYEWAKEDDIDIFYFSSFDEDWKVTDEGEYGSSWGIWDKNGTNKFIVK